MGGASNIRELAEELRRFAGARDWQQFHTPRNLASALIVEAAELLEHFQWLTDAESKAVMSSEASGEIVEELADVFIYLVRLADVCDVDLLAAASAKVERNGQRYTVDKSRGNARKQPGSPRDARDGEPS